MMIVMMIVLLLLFQLVLLQLLAFLLSLWLMCFLLLLLLPLPVPHLLLLLLLTWRLLVHVPMRRSLPLLLLLLLLQLLLQLLPAVALSARLLSPLLLLLRLGRRRLALPAPRHCRHHSSAHGRGGRCGRGPAHPIATTGACAGRLLVRGARAPPDGPPIRRATGLHAAGCASSPASARLSHKSLPAACVAAAAAFAAAVGAAAGVLALPAAATAAASCEGLQGLRVRLRLRELLRGRGHARRRRAPTLRWCLRWGRGVVGGAARSLFKASRAAGFNPEP
jgi:hypothetical protein